MSQRKMIESKEVIKPNKELMLRGCRQPILLNDMIHSLYNIACFNAGFDEKYITWTTTIVQQEVITKLLDSLVRFSVLRFEVNTKRGSPS